MCLPQNIGASPSPSVGSTVCPRCGLRLDVRDQGEQPEFRYDFPTWERLCQYPLLGGPTGCLEMQRRARTSDAESGEH